MGDFKLTYNKKTGILVAESKTEPESNRILTGEEFRNELIEIAAEAPDFALSRSIDAYPNPFTNEITFSYNLEKESSLTLELYNVLGEKLTILADWEMHQPGNYQYTYKADMLEEGFYMMSLNVGSHQYYKRLIKAN